MLTGVMFCTAGAILVAALSESALVGMFQLPGRAFFGAPLGDDHGLSEANRDF